MSAAFEQSPRHMPCVDAGSVGVHQLAPDLVLVVILVLILVGTPAGDVTALLTAASLLITQVSTNLRRVA